MYYIYFVYTLPGVRVDQIFYYPNRNYDLLYSYRISRIYDLKTYYFSMFISRAAFLHIWHNMVTVKE